MTTKEALSELKGKKVTIFFLNGFRDRGTLEEIYDDGGINFSDCRGAKNYVPGNAISTIQKYVY